jgi:hypothetical protein
MKLFEEAVECFEDCTTLMTQINGFGSADNLALWQNIVLCYTELKDEVRAEKAQKVS